MLTTHTHQCACIPHLKHLLPLYLDGQSRSQWPVSPHWKQMSCGAAGEAILGAVPLGSPGQPSWRVQRGQSAAQWPSCLQM